MPLGSLREALYSVPDQDVSELKLIGSGWHPAPKTSFTEVHACQEGYQCVSKTSRFGTRHFGEVDSDKAHTAQHVNEEDVEKGKQEQIFEYEARCPMQGRWRSDRFESGNEPEQCRDDKDCICIPRGASDGYIELSDGIEKRHITTEAQLGGDHNTQKMSLVLIPHYRFRKIPDGFDPANIWSDMGKDLEGPAEVWLNAYKNQAGHVQDGLDLLKNSISDSYAKKVKDQPFVCGAATSPDQQNTMTQSEVHKEAAKIRNFQVLQKECENLRDTVPQLISETSEKVSPPGQSFNPKQKTANCYKAKGGETCVQLNCYTSHRDRQFRDQLREMEAKLMACEPELEDMNAEPGSVSPTMAIGAAPEKKVRVVAGGENTASLQNAAEAAAAKAKSAAGAAAEGTEAEAGAGAGAESMPAGAAQAEVGAENAGAANAQLPDSATSNPVGPSGVPGEGEAQGAALPPGVPNAAMANGAAAGNGAGALTVKGAGASAANGNANQQTPGTAQQSVGGGMVALAALVGKSSPNKASHSSKRTIWRAFL